MSIRGLKAIEKIVIYFVLAPVAIALLILQKVLKLRFERFGDAEK